MKFQEQYKHPLWQKKRLEVMELFNFKCCECGSVDEQLHIHHPSYKKGKKIWEYESHRLICLCQECHAKYHEMDERLKESIGDLDLRSKMKALGYLDALMGPRIAMPDNKIYLEGFADEFRNDTNYLIHLIKKAV